LIIKSEKPVVMVGVMRPATAISADGLMSLLTAVAPAASDSAKGSGAMVVLNDRIGSAGYIIITNAKTPALLQAFNNMVRSAVTMSAIIIASLKEHHRDICQQDNQGLQKRLT
jgi:L-asparaginase/Glu-tRNA(Gln) amidotransferase subunit D